MLSERIYALRRKNGLSQEQLAEKLGVSRQAISKWETGQSTPELDKLIALSQCFGMTVDELTTGRSGTEESRPVGKEEHGRGRIWLGVALCLAGVLLMAAIGLTALLAPSAAEQINESSAITLNGSGLLFLTAIVGMALGVFLILRRR